jgi:hypothetical protein
MRDILKKVTTGSMIAGAALLIAACGGDTVENDANTTDLGNDTMLNDMDDMDLNAMDANMMGNGLEPALENAAEATENAAEAIENAQEAAE